MDRFVIGAGRCGSTLLSNMLGKHPDLLQLSEFFSALDPMERFSPEIVSGKEFARFLNLSNLPGEISFRRGNIPPEVLSDKTVSVRNPALMISTLPMLSDNPDDLYNELLSAVESFSDQTYLQHYRELFEWLLTRTGKLFWIERSGESTQHFSELVELFPDAKFIHIHRDGPESTLSMMNHMYFQLVISFFYDPPTEEELMNTEYGGMPVSDTDTFSRRLSPDYLPPEKYAEYWSYQQVMAFKALGKLNTDQYLDVRFENLVNKPHETLESISDFFQLPANEEWIEAAASLLKPAASGSRLKQLSPQDRAAIIQSCETGELLLGRKKSEWILPTMKHLRKLSNKRLDGQDIAR